MVTQKLNGGICKMATVMANLAAAVEFVKSFFNMIVEFFSSLFETATV